MFQKGGPSRLNLNISAIGLSIWPMTDSAASKRDSVMLDRQPHFEDIRPPRYASL